MKIANNMVVSLDYILRDDEGAVIDSSEGGSPLEYLHGHEQILPALEKELAGRETGASFQVKLGPKEGYGEYDPAKSLKLEREKLPNGMEPEVGLQLAAQGPNGEQIPLWIVEVGEKEVTVDANHPLAGQTLHFSVDVRQVRAATEEEMAHGHAHGEDGHHH